MSGRRAKALGLLSLALVCVFIGGCGPKMTDRREAASAQIEERWGVRIEGLRLVAAGYMVDFRYRVMDPEKAAVLQDKRERPYLIDEATGRAFAVPRPAKVGELRQTAFNSPPVAGKTYSMIFANPGRTVRRGALATVVVGAFRAGGLVIE